MTIRAQGRDHSVRVAVVAGIAAFTAYFAMYAFRKPFAAASYEQPGFFGSAVMLKTAFVVSQLLGYTAAKYLGIRICSEVSERNRGRILLGLGLWAEATLVLFALLPPAGRVAALFLNGLALGSVWGLVVRYLEGRRSSEILLAVLSLSYILASGPVKDIGRLLLSWKMDEYWMPAAVGLLFLPIYSGAVWMLRRLPPPDDLDRRLRSPRPSIGSAGRWAFLHRFGVGLVPLLILFFALTAFRDFRDNFGKEIFTDLHYDHIPGAFTLTELPSALGVLVALALLGSVRDNRRAVMLILMTICGGLVLLGVATALLDAGHISGMMWMTLIGLGAYLAYVPFGAMLFDRMVAYARFAGTAAFAIMLADAIGYTGSVCLFLTRDAAFSHVSRLNFLRLFSYGLTAGGVALMLVSAAYLLSIRPGLQTGESRTPPELIPEAAGVLSATNGSR